MVLLLEDQPLLDVTLVAKNGILTHILGGKIKEHGVEKLGRIELDSAVVKTGLLRSQRSNQG